MTDSEARGLVLKRLYDIRNTVRNASPKDFEDLQLGDARLVNVLEQLAQEDKIEWLPHPSGRTGKIDFFANARIKVLGVKEIEDAARSLNGKATQPPTGSQNAIDFSVSQKQFLDTLRERVARVQNGEVWDSDHPGPYSAVEMGRELDSIRAIMRSLEERTSAIVPLTGAEAKGEAGSFTPSPPVPLTGVALTGTSGARATGAGTVTVNAIVAHDLAALHAEIQKRIASIEETIAKLPIAGMGHNNPPEPIEPAPPLSEGEFAEITIYITLLKEQPAAPTQLPTQLGVGANRLKILSKKIYDHLEAHVIEYAISVAGTAMVTPWRQFGDDLMALGNSVTEWLMVLMHFN